MTTSSILHCIYLGVRIAMPSKVITASSTPDPTSAIDMILSRKTYTSYRGNIDIIHQVLVGMYNIWKGAFAQLWK